MKKGSMSSCLYQVPKDTYPLTYERGPLPGTRNSPTRLHPRMGEDAGCTSFLFCLLLLDDTYCYYFTNTIYKSSVKIQEIQRRKKKKQKSIPNPSPQGKKIEVSIHPDISFCIFKCLKYKIFHFKNSCLNSLSLILSSPSPPPLVYHYQFKMQFFNQIKKPVETTFTMSLLGTKEEMQKIPITL